MSKTDTKHYQLDVLTEEQKTDLLDNYGNNVAAADGIVPVVYGILNKETKVYEHYCANMPQALAVLTMLEEGLEEERKKLPKDKPTLRSV